MKTDRQFYETILEKQKQYRIDRRRRRGTAVGLCMLCVGMVCVLVVAVNLLSVSSNGPMPSFPTTTTGIIFHNGESDIHKFPNIIGIGGADPFRNKPLHDCISLNSSFDALVDPAVYDEWLSTFSHAGGTRDANEYNLYNFIHELNVPRSEIEQVCEQYNKIVEYEYYTAEQIEVLYTYTKYDAYRYFALDTTVIVGNAFYAIGWLADHTAADYIAAGMTASQVKTAYEASGGTLIDAEREYILQQLAIMDPNAVPTTTTTSRTTEPFYYLTTGYVTQPTGTTTYNAQSTTTNRRTESFIAQTTTGF